MAAFAEEGLDKPSLDAICARAGYTRGAFYVHFRDREDFQVAVMEHVVGSLIENLLGAGRGGTDLKQAVGAFVWAVGSEGWPSGQAVRSYHFFDACMRSPKLAQRFIEIVRGGMERAAELVRNDQEAGRVRRDVDPTQVATLLAALVIGAGSLTETGVPYDLEPAAATLIQVLRPPPE